MRSLAPILALGLILATPPPRAQAFEADAKRPLVSQVPASYPELARKMHLEGTVSIEITIQPDGHVGNATVLTGHPLLRPAAQEAVLQWRYGTATASTVSTVQIVFQLHR